MFGVLSMYIFGIATGLVWGYALFISDPPGAWDDEKEDENKPQLVVDKPDSI